MQIFVINVRRLNTFCKKVLLKGVSNKFEAFKRLYKKGSVSFGNVLIKVNSIIDTSDMRKLARAYREFYKKHESEESKAVQERGMIL